MMLMLFGDRKFPVDPSAVAHEFFGDKIDQLKKESKRHATE